jgi:hypothetical protein
VRDVKKVNTTLSLIGNYGLASVLTRKARAERQYQWRMQNDPLYHYVSELGGWYDDEEVEERHVADDLIRLIKDNY